MSSDPCINSTLFNLCARAHRNPTGQADRNTSHHANVGACTHTSSSNRSTSDGKITHHNDQVAIDAVSTDDQAPVPAKRSPEDYEWLRRAIANVESPERRVKTLLDTMEQQDITEDVMLDTLNELGDLVEDVNWAVEFKLMHGPARVLRVLRSSIGTVNGSDSAESIYAHSSVRAALATVVAHSSQLDDALQQSYTAEKWSDVLVPLLYNENAKACGQAGVAALLHACSCLCRGNTTNTTMFIQHGGLNVLESLLHTRRPASTSLACRSDAGVGTCSTADDNNEAHAASKRMNDKIISRVFFFVAYLGEVGVSTEQLIRLTCEYGSYNSTSDSVQRAIARALLQLLRQSPTLVKTRMRSVMAHQLQNWRALHEEQHGADSDDDMVDERVQLLTCFDSHS